MCKVIDIIKKSTSPFASFEIVPPVTGSDPQDLYKRLEDLLEFNPPFINITSHRDEEMFIENEDGSYRKLTLSRRPSTLAIAAAIMRKTNVEIVPHVICGGATMTQLERLLVDFNFLGIDNIVALRGDAMPGMKRYKAVPGGFEHCKDLVEMIQNLNVGRYIDPNVKNGVSTDFCVGVAGYPEKHFEASNIDLDIRYLKEKVDAGADYIVTQMFFDNSKFFYFEKRCREEGINVPIIPGLKPISSAAQLGSIPSSFHLDIPSELTSELLKAKTKEDQYRVGQDWCILQSKELIEHGVPAIHYYTMGRMDNVRNIVKSVF